MNYRPGDATVYPKKYAHGFAVFCFVVVMQSFIMNSHEIFIHIHQGCFAGTGAIVRLPQCPWSKPDGYGKICQCITTTKHSKAKTVCIFLGIYCMEHFRVKNRYVCDIRDSINILVVVTIYSIYSNTLFMGDTGSCRKQYHCVIQKNTAFIPVPLYPCPWSTPFLKLWLATKYRLRYSCIPLYLVG